MADKRIDEPTGTEFVGHEWDGIEELDTPMPRWWLWTFYATIAWAAVYVVLYPAWPLIEKGTEGALGWTSRGQLLQEMSAADATRLSFREQLANTPLERLPENSALFQQAVAGGAAAFRVHCVQCHGSGAGGSEGFPNLADDDWLWGGDLSAIEHTVRYGVRQEGVAQTRFSQMPAFAGVLEGAQLEGLIDHVLSLDGEGAGNAAGAAVYSQNCALCHGPAGEGVRFYGAPALNDAIWLYGGSRDQIRQQILDPRMGMMPGWENRLDQATIRMVAAYVHSLGGGEASPVQAATSLDQAGASQEAATAAATAIATEGTNDTR